MYQTVLVLLICNIKGPVKEKKGCRMRVTIKKNTREIVAKDYAPLSIIHEGWKLMETRLEQVYKQASSTAN